MREIVELSRRIISEAPEAIPKEFGFLMVLGRKDNSSVLATLPVGIRTDLEQLCGRLSEGIPDDFEYQLILADNQPGIVIVYNDGAQTQANCAIEWDEGHSIFETLDEIDWEGQRQDALARCQSFEVMKEEAKHRPATLPSTKQLQKAFRGEMKSFVKEKRKDASRIHVLMYREENGLDDECGLQERIYETLKELADDLYNIMTVRYWVVMVVADGKPLPVSKIDELKKRALKELEDMPISLLKALGKL